MGRVLDREDAKEKWLDQLQSVLNAQGCDIDLRNKEDLARLVIMNTKETEDGLDVDMTYAFDKEQKPIYLKQLDEAIEFDKKEMLDGQGEGVIDDDTLERLFTASQEGKLYVAPLIGSENERNFRMIRTELDGNPFIEEDMDHLSPEDNMDYNTLYNIPPEPVAPKKPSIGTRFLAFFGNKKAKETVSQYNEDKVTYEADKKEYKECKQKAFEVAQKKPWLKNFADAMAASVGNIENSAGLASYEASVAKLHRESLVKGCPENEKVYQLDQIEKKQRLAVIGRQLAEIKGGTLIAGNIGLDDTAKNLVAEALVLRSEMVRGEKMYLEGHADLYKPAEDLTNQIQGLVDNDIYKAVCDTMDCGELIDFADKNIDPETALDFVKKFSANMKTKIAEQTEILNSIKAPQKSTPQPVKEENIINSKPRSQESTPQAPKEEEKVMRESESLCF